jgi:hypothetical protein
LRSVSNASKIATTLKATKAVLEEVPDLKKKMANIKKTIDLQPVCLLFVSFQTSKYASNFKTNRAPPPQDLMIQLQNQR